MYAYFSFVYPYKLYIDFKTFYVVNNIYFIEKNNNKKDRFE